MIDPMDEESQRAPGADTPDTPVTPDTLGASDTPNMLDTLGASGALSAPDTSDTPDTSTVEEPAAAEPTAAEPAAAEEPAGDEPPDATFAAPETAPLFRSTDELAVTEPLKSRMAQRALAELGAISGISTEGPSAAPGPLEPGAIIAGYTVGRLLRDSGDGRVYRAIPPEAPEAPEADGTAAISGQETPPWRYVVREAPEADAPRIEAVVKAGARAAGLLAPVGFAREGGRAFVIGVELPGPNESDDPAPPLGSIERLRPVDALTACAQLASALIALHRAGLAHLHISPEVVTLYDGRVYLGGVEDATVVTDPEEAKDLYARDANFLARTAGALGGATEVALWERDSSAQRSLREINARGRTGGYATAEEVADAASLALNVLMVGGAALGADVRAVRLRITSGAYSSVGRVRSENQDAWGATLFDLHDDAAADAPLGVFLVADGMGGEAHGEIASRFVARIVTAEMAKRFLEPQAAWPALAVFTAAAEDATAAPQLPLAQALEQAVKEANRRTRAFGARLNATTGSTVTALAVAGARAALAHLGDSRAYLLRDGQLIQLTEDHSLLARLEAIQHPMLEDPNFMVPRSVLYRSIGQEDDTTPDMLQFALAPGDRLMMCSDGLWDEVANDAIQRVMTAAADPASCAEALVALANATGGHDNSTAVVVFVHALAADTPFVGGETSEASEPGGSDEREVSGLSGESGAPDGE